MTEFIEVLQQEHRNIESLLRVLERELSVFDRGERLDYEVVLAIIKSKVGALPATRAAGAAQVRGRRRLSSEPSGSPLTVTAIRGGLRWLA